MVILNLQKKEVYKNLKTLIEYEAYQFGCNMQFKYYLSEDQISKLFDYMESKNIYL